MGEKITHDDIDRQFNLLRSDPQKFLDLTNEFVEQRPRDAGAYFVRQPGVVYNWAIRNVHLGRSRQID